MDIPVGRLQHATKASGGHLGRGSVGKLFQGFPLGVQGLHADQPTEDEAMPAFPDARHPAKQDRDKQGHIGDCDHSLRHRARSVGNQESGISGLSLYHTAPFALILKAL